MKRLGGAITAIAIGCMLLTIPQPLAAAQFSPEQTTEIQNIVKSYLLDHPELLKEVITALDDREKQADEQARKKALVDLAGPLNTSPDGFVIGNPDGKITLIEFFDYNCGYCKRALPDLARLMKDNTDLRVILRDFPILSPASVDAAIIAGAAHEQFQGEKFWDFHKTLLGQHGLVGKEQAVAVAKDMGADMDKLTKDAANPRIRNAIQNSDTLAKGLNLNGTPSFVLGGDVQIGAIGYEALSFAIGNIRKCGKAMCS